MSAQHRTSEAHCDLSLTTEEVPPVKYWENHHFARKSSRKPRNFFAELNSRTSATRFSSQLLCLHLSGAIMTRSNARFSHDVIDGCRDVLAETSRKDRLLKKFLRSQKERV